MRKLEFYGPIKSLNWLNEDYLVALKGSFCTLISTSIDNCPVVHDSKEISGHDLRGCKSLVEPNQQNDEIHVLFWSAKHFAVYKLDLKDAAKWTPASEVIMIDQNDLILDGILLPNSTIIIVTAKCKFYKFIGSELIAVTQPKDQYLCYSISLQQSGDEIFASAGNIYSDIILYSLDLKTFQVPKIVNVFRGHTGIAMHSILSKDTGALVSCSEDRTVRLWDVSSGLNTSIAWILDSRVWRVQFVDDERILSASEDSCVRLWQIPKSGNGDKLILLKCWQKHGKGSVWSIEANKRFAFSGGNDGQVFRYDLNLPCNYKAFLQPSSDTSQISIINDNQHQIVAISSREGDISISILSFDFELLETNRLNNPVKSPLVLCKLLKNSKNVFLATYSKIFPTKLNLFIKRNTMFEYYYSLNFSESSPTCLAINEEDRLYVAACNGHLIIYDEILRDIRPDPSKSFTQLETRRDIICSIDCFGDYIIVGRRSGIIKFCKVDVDSTRLDIIGTYAFIPNGNLYGVFLDEKMLLRGYGFYKQSFVVVDARTHEFLAQIETGGTKKRFDCSSSQSQACMAYLRDDNSIKIERAEFNADCRNIIKATHGREIRCFATSPQHTDIVASGSEDTEIRINKICSGKLTELERYTGHVTGLKQMMIMNNFIFSSASKEELFVSKLHFLEGTSNVSVSNVFRLPVLNQTALGRILTFQTVCKDEFEGSMFHIIAAYTNFKIVVWDIKIENEKVTANVALEWAIKTCINHLKILYITQGYTILLACSHDGCLAILKCSRSAIEEIFRMQTHQGVILSLKVSQLTDSSWLIFTGGDDGAIGCFVCNGAKIEARDFKASVHAAGITGLEAISVSSNNWQVLSSSADQRLKIWEFSFDSLLKPKAHLRTSVCDVMGLKLIDQGSKDKLAVVYGQGMEIWEL